MKKLINKNMRLEINRKRKYIKSNLNIKLEENSTAINYLFIVYLKKIEYILIDIEIKSVFKFDIV